MTVQTRQDQNRVALEHVSNTRKEFELNTINQFVKKSNVVVGVLLATQLTMNHFKLNQDGPMEMLAIVQMLPMELFSVSEV